MRFQALSHPTGPRICLWLSLIEPGFEFATWPTLIGPFAKVKMFIGFFSRKFLHFWCADDPEFLSASSFDFSSLSPPVTVISGAVRLSHR